MVPRPALIIAVLFLASAALFLTVSDSDSSDAAVIDGKCGKDGDNLLWSYDEDTRVLTITGSGGDARLHVFGQPPLDVLYVGVAAG
jgi:hypothetical protein